MSSVFPHCLQGMEVVSWTTVTQYPTQASVSSLVLPLLSPSILCSNQSKWLAILQMKLVVLIFFMSTHTTLHSQKYPLLKSLPQAPITLHKSQLRYYLFHECFLNTLCVVQQSHGCGGGSHWICFTFLTLSYNLLLASPLFSRLYNPWRNWPLSSSCFQVPTVVPGIY